jgi:hypothetical protein
MSKTHETLKTICQGALGGITFGVYHHYTSNKMMELNNEKIKIQQKCFMDKIDKIKNNHKTDMIEMVNKQKILNDKLEKALSNKIDLNLKTI